MEVVYPCCCGLDVHKKRITACVLWAEAKGKSRKEKRRFGTFTHDLLQAGRLAWGMWRNPCGHGVDGSVLEASVEHSCGAVRGVIGERAAHQSRARPEDGPERQRVDCGFAAARVAPREFRAPATHA